MTLRQLRDIPRQPVLDTGLLRRGKKPGPSLLDLRHVALVRSGRSAIALALQLLGVKAGDHVLVPTYHCPTMISPVVRLGAIPVFYPLNPSGEPDIGCLESMRTEHCRALLAPHLFGIPRDFAPVVTYCRKRGIAFIEDCAHCFYGSFAGQPIGTLGDFSIGSLPKFFPIREGGLLASNQRPISLPIPGHRLTAEVRSVWDAIDLASRAGRLGPIGSLGRAISRMRHRQGETAVAETAERSVDDDEVARRWLADPLLEVRSSTKVERFLIERSHRAAACRARVAAYEQIRARLCSHSRVTEPGPECAPECAPYVMPLVVEDPEPVYRELRSRRMPVFRWDEIWPGTPVLPGDTALRWNHGLIQFACHQSLTEQEIDVVCKAANEAMDGDGT